MRVVILGAGLGERLGSSLPKPLARLATGQTILDRQLECLGRYVSLDQVLLVVGYKKDVVIDRYPNLMYVYNPDFAVENTAKSLLRAVKKLDEDVLWLNGDVVFRSVVLEAVIGQERDCMLVNKGKVAEEEVKYRADENDRILEVSKEVKAGDGEALGINKITKASLPRFKANLERCQAMDYFEKALEWSIQQGMQLFARQVPVEACIEVDFPEDLANANALLRQWERSRSREVSSYRRPL